MFSLSPVVGQKPALTTYLTTVKNFISGISAVGSAGGLGPSGREFESPISDQDKLTDHQGVGLSTFMQKNMVNSLCRSGFTAVFFLLEGNQNECNTEKRSN